MLTFDMSSNELIDSDMNSREQWTRGVSADWPQVQTALQMVQVPRMHEWEPSPAVVLMGPAWLAGK